MNNESFGLMTLDPTSCAVSPTGITHPKPHWQLAAPRQRAACLPRPNASGQRCQAHAVRTARAFRLCRLRQRWSWELE